MIQGQLELDFKGRVVLDLGCGHGWLAALLPELSGAKRAIGVDPRRYDTWAEHTDDRVSLIEADMTVDHVVDEGSVDCLISGAVLEHVERPIEMLAAIHDCARSRWPRMAEFQPPSRPLRLPPLQRDPLPVAAPAVRR